jgi:hypothetical protein
LAPDPSFAFRANTRGVIGGLDWFLEVLLGRSFCDLRGRRMIRGGFKWGFPGVSLAPEGLAQPQAKVCDPLPGSKREEGFLCRLGRVSSRMSGQASGVR